MRFLIAIVLLIGCSKSPDVPPAPTPSPVAQSFSVVGKNIKVDGMIKAGSVVTAAEAKSAVTTAVSILEK